MTGWGKARFLVEMTGWVQPVCSALPASQARMAEINEDKRKILKIRRP